jgi:voltage-dependent potassium channel beta subunit
MEYRHLGKTGIRVSELSFGSWVTFHNQVDVKPAVEMMAAAYDAGVNFFDNAEVYAAGKSEEVMGKALKELKWRRGSYLISTKLFWGLHDNINEKNTLNRKRLIEGINGSLQRLDMEYVDLIYCHRPDKTTPIEETVWAMHNIIEWGKAFYWGTSEWAASEIIEAIQIAERHHLHKPVVEQPEYNMFARKRLEGDYVRFYKDYNYGTTIWSPLASGLLTGKYNNGIPEGSRGALKGYEWLKDDLTNEAKIAKVKALEPFVSTVITGASRVEQVHENMKAAEIAPKITAEIMEKIDTIFEIKKEEEDD